MIAVQLQFKDIPDPRKKLENLGEHFFRGQVQRGLEIFDKYNSVGYGQQIYYFFVRYRTSALTPEQLAKLLDNLEEIFNRYGQNEKEHWLIGIALDEALGPR